jgi:hypothetical protein
MMEATGGGGVTKAEGGSGTTATHRLKVDITQLALLL